MSTTNNDIEYNIDNFPPDKDPVLLEEAKKEEYSIYKEKVLENLTITEEDKQFEADVVSQNRMASTLAIGSVMYLNTQRDLLEAMLQDPNASDEFKQFANNSIAAFDSIFVNQEFGWKVKDGSIATVNILKLKNVLYKTFMKLSELILKTV